MYYNQYYCKIEFYREGFAYNSASWKARISYQKPTNKQEDRWK